VDDNTAPVADGQQVTTAPNTASGITLTGSDSNGDQLTYRVVTGPGSGVLNGDAPDLTYTPDAGFSGPDSFTFVVNDGTVDSEAATVSINVVGVVQARLAFGPEQDPEDGAAGLGLSITGVLDGGSETEAVPTWGGYRAKLTYDGACVNILEIREREFSVTVNSIDDSAGVAEFEGNAGGGSTGPAELAQVVSRTLGSGQTGCSITVEVTGLTDEGGNPVEVEEASLTRELRRGDANADGVVNVADAMYIAQYLEGMRSECTPEIESTCLHSLNAANWEADGGIDRVTMADAVSLGQHLTGTGEGP
jgi:hypothetical protein